MADTSKRLAGIASFTIEGTTYQLVGDLKYSVSRRERESLVGMDSYHGYSEKIIPGFMECTLRDSSVVSLRTFEDMTSVTVVATTSNGKTVSGQQLVCMKAIEVEVAEGKFSVRFEGDQVGES